MYLKTEKVVQLNFDFVPSFFGRKKLARKSSTGRDLIMITVGSIITSLGLVYFTIPNKIVSGGLTGLATIMFFTFGLPVGIVVLIGNLFLVFLQSWLIGFKSVWKTIFSVILTGVSIDLLMKVFSVAPATHDPILACLYGGILGGIGVSIVFRAGGTTGGVDIIGQIVNHFYHIPVGDVILGTNLLITFFAGYAFGPELALYGFITIFFSGRVIDAALEGMSIYRTVLIITKNPDELSWGIMEELHHGVTSIDGRGMYTGKPSNILLVAVRRMEMPRLREIIYEFDPHAFVIIGDARQVLGKGFVSLGDQMSPSRKE